MDIQVRILSRLFFRLHYFFWRLYHVWKYLLLRYSSFYNRNFQRFFWKQQFFTMTSWRHLIRHSGPFINSLSSKISIWGLHGLIFVQPLLFSFSDDLKPMWGSLKLFQNLNLRQIEIAKWYNVIIILSI
jgi:hypothetical protein